VACAGDKRVRPAHALAKDTELDRLRVVLVATRNPLNMGAAARAMSNFGFLNLRVVNPYDVTFREARSAVGASAVMKGAEEFSGLAEAVSDCSLVVGTTTLRNRERHQPRYQLEEGGRRIRKALASGRVALLFGSEKVGLSNDDLSHCHWLMHIPTREEHPSMNLGQAVAVCLYELIRGGRVKAAAAKVNAASARELERLTEILVETLRDSGYLGKNASDATTAKIRRLVRRLKLDDADAELLLGMLRQVQWKIRAL